MASVREDGLAKTIQDKIQEQMTPEAIDQSLEKVLVCPQTDASIIVVRARCVCLAGTREHA